MLNPALLDHALSVTTPDRLLFSTDYPFQQPTRAEIASFADQFPAAVELERFTTANADALFGLHL